MAKYFTTVALMLCLSAGTAFTQSDAGYAPVNGIEMYYEIHGSGEPLILLHGGLGAIEMFAPILPALAEGRQVIAADLQAHGRTLPGDRPLTFESLADDVAGLIRHLGHERASIMGYSLGGMVAMQTAIRHPELVDRLVVVSAPYARSGWHDYNLEGMAQVGAHMAEMMHQTPMYELYAQVSPDVENWPVLLDLVGELVRQDFDWSREVSVLPMPVLLAVGDWDSVRTAHVASFFELLGGGARDAKWDRSGIGTARLAVIPDATHYDVFVSPMLVDAVTSFLDDPPPSAPVGDVSVTMPSPREVVITRRIDAPRDRVWAAWTKAEHIRNWMTGPPGWRTTTVESDPRAGGEYAFAWIGPAGEDLRIRGTYTEIDRPERLVSIDKWDGDWPETENTLTLTEDGGGTIVTLTILYPSEADRDNAMATGMTDGLAGTLTNLDGYLAELP